jgi:hypothetical protein
MVENPLMRRRYVKPTLTRLGLLRKLTGDFSF